MEKNSAFPLPERRGAFCGSFEIGSGCSAFDKWDNLVTENGVATEIKGPSVKAVSSPSKPHGALERLGCVSLGETRWMAYFKCWLTI